MDVWAFEKPGKLARKLASFFDGDVNECQISLISVSDSVVRVSALLGLIIRNDAAILLCILSFDAVSVGRYLRIPVLAREKVECRPIMKTALHSRRMHFHRMPMCLSLYSEMRLGHIMFAEYLPATICIADSAKSSVLHFFGHSSSRYPAHVADDYYT